MRRHRNHQSGKLLNCHCFRIIKFEINGALNFFFISPTSTTSSTYIIPLFIFTYSFLRGKYHAYLVSFVVWKIGSLSNIHTICISAPDSLFRHDFTRYNLKHFIRKTTYFWILRIFEVFNFIAKIRTRIYTKLWGHCIQTKSRAYLVKSHDTICQLVLRDQFHIREWQTQLKYTSSIEVHTY